MKILRGRNRGRIIITLAIFCIVTLFNSQSMEVFGVNSPRRAIITTFEGAVTIQKAGNAIALPARKGMEIKAGDRIITGCNGTIELRYDDGSVTRVSPDSRVKLEALHKEKGVETYITLIRVDRGSLWNKVENVTQVNSRFEVSTPSAVAGVQGTGFIVSVGDLGHTSVRVYEGIVGIGGRQDTDSPPGSDSYSSGELLLNPYQQVSMRLDTPPPPQPDPINLLDVDEWEKDNLVEDIPVAFVEVETNVKEIVLEQIERVLQESRVQMVLTAQELQALQRLIAAETDSVRLTDLRNLQEQKVQEFEMQRDVVRDLDKERTQAAEERERLAQLRDIIRNAIPTGNPAELNRKISEEARSIRQEDRAKGAEKQQRQEQRNQQTIEIQQARQEATQRATNLGVQQVLEQARATVNPHLMELINQGAQQHQLEQMLIDIFSELNGTKPTPTPPPVDTGREDNYYVPPVPPQASITDVSIVSDEVHGWHPTLVASISPTGATANYQWQIADTEQGAYTNNGIINDVLTISPNDTGKYIRVIATGIGTYSGQVTSAVYGPVPEFISDVMTEWDGTVLKVTIEYTANIQLPYITEENLIGILPQFTLENSTDGLITPNDIFIENGHLILLFNDFDCTDGGQRQFTYIRGSDSSYWIIDDNGSYVFNQTLRNINIPIYNPSTLKTIAIVNQSNHTIASYSYELNGITVYVAVEALQLIELPIEVTVVTFYTAGLSGDPLTEPIEGYSITKFNFEDIITIEHNEEWFHLAPVAT